MKSQEQNLDTLNIKNDPDYLAGWTRLQDLTVERNSLDRRISQLRRRATTLNADQQKRTESEAAGLVVGLASTHATALAAIPAPEQLGKEMEEARKRCKTLDRAIVLQNVALRDLRTKASKAICDRVKDDHRERVRRVVERFSALAKANDDLVDLQSSLNDGDVTWVGHFCPMNISQIGNLDPKEPYSLVQQYVREAYDHGFISQAEKVRFLHSEHRAPQALIPG